MNQIAIALFLLLSHVSNLVYADYSPSVELELKAGNLRHIGRASLVLPLLQNENHLLYFNSIGMFDSRESREGNVGLGYRILHNKHILGGFLHYDRRKSPHNHLFEQMTLGLEFFTKNFEFRANAYLPLSGRAFLDEREKFLLHQVGTKLYLNKVKEQTFETPQGGFDVELGTTLSKIPLSVYGAYYHFSANNTPSVDGFRLRCGYELASGIRLTTELQHDGVRGFSYFGGLNLRMSFGDKRTFQSVLSKKMTQMPIRDIDIVVGNGDSKHILKANSVILIRNWNELQGIRDNLDGHYLILNDIDGHGALHKPIGNEDSPFTGVLLGAEVRGNKIIPTIRRIFNYGYDFSELALLRLRVGAFGLFASTWRAHIGYVGLEHLGLTPPAQAKPQRIGSLAGNINSTTIEHTYNKGQVNVPADYEGDERVYGSAIGGLVGNVGSESSISHSYNTGNVTGRGKAHVGGLVGNGCWYSCTISHSYNTGNVTGGDSSKVGGLAGSGGRNISHSYNTGNVTGGWYSQVGGLIGHSKCRSDNRLNNITIACNYNIGNVTGGRYSLVGGLVGLLNNGFVAYSYNKGRVTGEVLSKVGGLVGEFYDGKCSISQSYNTGSVTAGENSFVGGLVGEINYGGIITHNYNIGSVTGGRYSLVGGLVGVGGASMRSRATITHNYNKGGVTAGEDSSVGDLVGDLAGEQGDKVYNSIILIDSAAGNICAPNSESNIEIKPRVSMEALSRLEVSPWKKSGVNYYFSMPDVFKLYVDNEMAYLKPHIQKYGLDLSDERVLADLVYFDSIKEQVKNGAVPGYIFGVNFLIGDESVLLKSGGVQEKMNESRPSRKFTNTIIKNVLEYSGIEATSLSIESFQTGMDEGAKHKSINKAQESLGNIYSEYYDHFIRRLVSHQNESEVSVGMKAAAASAYSG